MTPAPPAMAVQPPPPTRSNRLPRLAAAAAVVALIAGLAIAVRQQDRVADVQAHNHAIIAVITAPDAQLTVRELDGVTAISLNTEPMGGSSQPTSDPVLTPTLQG